ncbi:MAG: MotA/TolQ/ExbB proton channel family protein, partial [Alphaproteobacteria bacterium]|nr:MotA/TolQ/ExbB proton channel family protein [Alphaproteobacteria bacterium]
MENSFSLLSLFSGRDLMTLSVSLILVAASIMSWAVIIEKIRLWNFQKHRPVSVKSGDNLDTIVDKLIRPFDKNLWFLSMVSYVAPFIGLFGTVW